MTTLQQLFYLTSKIIIITQQYEHIKPKDAPFFILWVKVGAMCDYVTKVEKKKKLKNRELFNEWYLRMMTFNCIQN